MMIIAADDSPIAISQVRKIDRPARSYRDQWRVDNGRADFSMASAARRAAPSADIRYAAPIFNTPRRHLQPAQVATADVTPFYHNAPGAMPPILWPASIRHKCRLIRLRPTAHFDCALDVTLAISPSMSANGHVFYRYYIFPMPLLV